MSDATDDQNFKPIFSDYLSPSNISDETDDINKIIDYLKACE